jgi:hypothetical protein
MATEEFGADVSTFPDLDVTGRGIKDTRSVAECVLRRWSIPHGSLSYDPDAGYDLRDLLNEDLDDSDLRKHEVGAALEAEKDERVRSMSVSMALDPRTFRLTVKARGVLVDGRDFSLTASISQISVELLAVA